MAYFFTYRCSRCNKVRLNSNGSFVSWAIVSGDRRCTATKVKICNACKKKLGVKNE